MQEQKKEAINNLFYSYVLLKKVLLLSDNGELSKDNEKLKATISNINIEIGELIQDIGISEGVSFLNSDPNSVNTFDPKKLGEFIQARINIGLDDPL
ncbi:hypothetical protein [Nostoc sp. CALU 1950]|uniref:hypothetical protein n=1 Tax=Nostoc sp. CALU 1950 TaxID=3104321 RepID=UPI003EBF9569